MAEKKQRIRFFLCGDCGLQLSGKSKTRKCHNCQSKDIGELQIKWPK